MEERKNRLIELEKSASDFVDTLKRLTVEIDGYKNANTRMEDLRISMLPLLEKTTQVLSAVNALQMEIGKITSNELLTQIETLEMNVANMAGRLETLTTNVEKMAYQIMDSAKVADNEFKSQQTSISALQSKLLEMDEKFEAFAPAVQQANTSVEKLLRDSEHANIVRENLAGSLKSVTDQVSSVIETGKQHTTNLESLVKQQNNQQIWTRLTLFGVAVCLVLIVVFR